MGWGGAGGTVAEGSQESRRTVGRRGALEQSLHCGVQNVVSSIFSHFDLDVTLGSGSTGQEV